MCPTPLADVHGAPVVTAGVHVGAVGDLYVDPAVQRVLGVEVIGPNDRRWYLPWAAAVLEDGTVKAASPLVFLRLDEARIYVEHGVRLELCELDDVAVEAAGSLARRPPAVLSETGREGTGVA